MSVEIALSLDLRTLLQKIGADNAYPPYDFIRYVKDGIEYYVLELSVSGFNKDQLFVELIDDLLTIKSMREQNYGQYEYYEFLHKGIARRNFKHVFRVHDRIKLTGDVRLESGLLSIWFMLKERMSIRRVLFPISDVDQKLKLT